MRFDLGTVVDKALEARLIFDVNWHAGHRILAWAHLDLNSTSEPRFEGPGWFTKTRISSVVRAFSSPAPDPTLRGTCGEVEIHQLRHGFQAMQCTPHCLGRDERGAIKVYILATGHRWLISHPFPILSQLVGTSGTTIIQHPGGASSALMLGQSPGCNSR